MTRRQEGPNARVCFTLWWYRIGVLAAFAVFAALLLSLVISTENVSVVAGGSAGLAFVVLLAIRAVSIAHLEIRQQEVLIRELRRTRRIPWSRVRDAGVSRGTSAFFLPWRVPYFELEDGSIVLADEIRSIRDDAIADRVVAEARQRIQGAPQIDA